MIIREQAEHFICIEQHEHARLSGEIASNLSQEFLSHDQYMKDVLYAIYEHDRAWIRMDETPIWNDQASEPYYFVNYPYTIKLKMYQAGIEEVEEHSQYAAYLVSRHFTQFPDIQNGKDEYSKTFCAEEEARQNRLRKDAAPREDEVIDQHYRLLQFSDDLSLYVCMNEPGVSKEEEHPWFKNGLSQIRDAAALQAEWLDNKTIQVTPSPFAGPFKAELAYKKIPKQLIQEKGLKPAYDQISITKQPIQFK
ncbi:DUF3891 family protein [Neobacillus mesonae]|nr:DUF3891 family protein [Neobacillus mesonae]